MEAVADDSVLPARATLPWVAWTCGALVLVATATVLLGWALGVEVMTSGLPGLTTMKVNTAICLGALAVTALSSSTLVVRAGCLLVLVLTAATTVEIIADVNLGIDEVFVADHTAKSGVTPGQMAPATVLSLIVLAVSRLALDLGRSRAAQALLSLPLLTAVVTLFGYLFGVEQFYRVSTLSSVAVGSAADWGLLTIAFAAMVPGGLLPWIVGGSGPGSAIVRGTLPIVTVGLTALGLTRDALIETGAIGDRFGTAVMVVAGSAIAVVATGLTARRYDGAHRARLRAEHSLRKLNSTLVEGRDAAWARAEVLAAQLEHERSRFERAVANTEDLVWTLETTGGAITPVYVSPNARPTIGAPLPAGASFPGVLHGLVDPVDQTILAEFETSVLGGVPVDVELRVHGLDGRYRWIWLRGTPRTEAGRSYVDGIATDITARRALADQREVLLDQERLQVQRLEELARIRQEFTTVAGHELRTPVTVIVGYCEMLADPELAPDVREQAVEALSRRAAELQELVEGVFDLAKLDAGALQLQLEPVHLDDFVAATVADYEPVARAAGLELTHTIEAAEIVADRSRLRQALDNVLSNAIKYTPAGGHLEVVVSCNSPDVVIEVRDDGIGVGAEELPRLFERMFRGANARDARIPGTGLGLALTKELVEALGGTVRARANEPHGLVITLTLPARNSSGHDLAGTRKFLEGLMTGQ